jgi:mycofactocin system glycosyltransferase
MLTLSPAGAAVFAALRDGRPVRSAGAGAGLLARRLVDAGLAHPVPGTREDPHRGANIPPDPSPEPPPDPGPGPDPDSAPEPGGAAPARVGLGRLDVTAVVPVRDQVREIGPLVRALAATCAAVVVVDDGSVDATGAAAAAAGARVLRHDRALGPGLARQAGAAVVDTPLVYFCDADVRPGADGPARLLAHLADPAVAAVAPRVASALPTGRVASLLARYESARSPLDLGPRPGPVRPGSRISYVPSAALLIRRELVGFDPALRFGEDVDLVWRLVAAGWSVRYEPTVVVTHRPRSGWSAWARQRFGYGSSAGALAVRHPGPLRPALAAALAAAAATALAAGTDRRRRTAPLVAAATAVWATGTARRLTRRLGSAPRPTRLAWALTAQGGRFAIEAAADNARRGWLPLLAGAGRPGRRALAAAVLVPAARDWWTGRPDVGPLPYLVLRFADDAAYCAGVWWGCARARTAAPLIPAVRLPNRRGRPADRRGPGRDRGAGPAAGSRPVTRPVRQR